jgi:hypothetical protein
MIENDSVEVKPMPGLTEGRIVHFVMNDGEHRPAIIVRVWKVSGACEGYVNLQVFTDGTNDRQPRTADAPNASDDLNDAIETGILWRTSICCSESKEPNTWHWIEPA